MRLPTACGRRILVEMLLWLLLASLVVLVVLTATGGLSVRRYTGRHVVAQLAVGGRVCTSAGPRTACGGG
jgi:hypothetical protein